MATRGVSTVVTYRAWDTSANTPKTGDSANHTLKWIKDGTAASPTNSPSEVDSTNAPGVYKLTLTATETDCVFGVLSGKSGTASVSIFGVQIGFEYVPTSSTTFGAFIGNATAALAVDASGRVDVSKVAGTAQTAKDLGAQLDATVSSRLASASYTAPDNAGIAAIETTLGTPAVSVSADIAAVQTHGDANWATATGFAVAGDAMTLTAAYDAAKTAAQAGDSMDITSINGDATSAANLAKTTRAIARGTVTTGASTTSIPTSAFSPSGSAADQFKGRIITFDADTTTAALRGQSTDITASSASATPTLTVTALTSTPAAGDTFSVT